MALWLIGKGVGGFRTWLVVVPERRAFASAIATILMPFGAYGVVYGVVMIVMAVRQA